ncbi:gibberellin 2-beta-dioxygenase 2-like [Magnolia sinica]|uniref:gibberellin 2-beta-dioxygenase 2-like n=1 Tax=Magnolia sinica TaxID=86752 RepID=UPI0026586CEC|nr:gibberellin 2-beta-dioxygenase 2-like [Magnolia sinica]
MVVASPTPIGSEKIQSVGVPVIDLSHKRSHVSELIVKACEDYGFFKVINHGIPDETISKMEAEGHDFFSRPTSEKQKAGPPNPLGYGCRNIGFNGDTGEVEYLLLHTNPLSISQRSRTICKDPMRFCCVVNDYIEAVQGLACEILDLLAEGLRLHDRRVLSRLIKESDSDSVFRLNHYPSSRKEVDKGRDMTAQCRIGFGEHSDPQILTILRSNDVGGLQISVDDGVWVPILPDPAAFCINVGDALQALTNGRFLSVRHRAMANSCKARMSMIYFGAPPLHARISPLPEMITPINPCLYRPFTWSEYKKAAYSLRLGDRRLDLFLLSPDEEDQ